MYQQVERIVTMQVNISRPGVSAQPALKCRFVAGRCRHAIVPRATAGNGKGGIGRLSFVTFAIQRSGFLVSHVARQSAKGPILVC